MLKKTITYEDYEGITRTEDHYFNLTEAELTMMEASELGGYRKKLENIAQALDGRAVIDVVKDIIERSYGKKSPDGKRFIKSKEIYEEFAQTEAYSQLFMELVTDDNAAGAFVVGVLPKSLSEKVKGVLDERRDEENEVPRQQKFITIGESEN